MRIHLCNPAFSLYRTLRGSRTPLKPTSNQADAGSAEPPQESIGDTAELNISEEEELRDQMADQNSGADEEDQAATNTDIEAIRADEEDPAVNITDTEPIRVDTEAGSVADIQGDESDALHRLSLADENPGNPTDIALPESQPPTPDVPSSTPQLSNQGDLQAQTESYDDLGAGLPSTHASPAEPNIVTLPLNQSVDVPAQSSIPAERETPETRDIEDGIERLAPTENIATGQLDGTACSTRNIRDMQSSDADSEQGRPSTNQRDRQDIGASASARDGDRASVSTIGPPRWQPDAEVTYCPICRTQFSFFIRKHHCRKCGRVVCANCSPHRITIPYQFIVQPPVSGPTAALPITQLAGRDTENLSQFGGTKVRLCNPCVPDPNTLPPQPQRTAADERWRHAPPTYYLSSNSRPYSFGEQDMENLEREASASSVRSRAVSSTGASHHRQLSQNLYPPRSSSQTSYLGGTSYTGPHQLSHGSPSYQRRYPNRNLPGPRHQSHQSLSMSSTGSPSNAQPHYRSLLDPFASQQPQSSASGVDTSRPLPPIPRIREEDECPVCHRELPSRVLPDFETLRSNHVTDCIEEQIAIHSGRPRQQSPASVSTPHQRPAPATMASSASSPAPQGRSNSPNSTTSSSSSQGETNLAQAINLQPPAPEISSFPNTPEGRTAFREAQHAAVVLGHTRASSHSPLAHPSSSFSPEPRRTGMFPYKATEKDCVDDAECTICLEEFEVGVQMARLECLCRFHEKCIRSWWEGKPGRCPVHGHDAWGL
ncbi:hypothetical protein V490_08319 [Pseudogymnoascus sp. VKM F-3557]|nr:hypothetical protein V490_08319 [Pseudogymnoascus sp. VKM F-3557]